MFLHRISNEILTSFADGFTIFVQGGGFTLGIWHHIDLPAFAREHLYIRHAAMTQYMQPLERS